MAAVKLNVSSAIALIEARLLEADLHESEEARINAEYENAIREWDLRCASLIRNGISAELVSAKTTMSGTVVVTFELDGYAVPPMPIKAGNPYRSLGKEYRRGQYVDGREELQFALKLLRASVGDTVTLSALNGVKNYL